MSVIGSNILAGASGSQGYQISRSVRLRSSANAYFSRTFGTATSTTQGTFSFWLKRGNLSASFSYLWSASNYDLAYFDGSGTLWVAYLSNLGYVSTNAVFRDPSAWYHVVITFDTPNATATNRLRVYVNGVQQTLNWGTTPQTQNATWQRWNVSGYTGDIGDFQFNHANPFDGYYAEWYFIDGQALTPTSFGQFNSVTGVWQPIKYTGTYGTNGFYLNFSDNSAATAAAIGKDYSGNGNNWTPNNISVTAGVTYDSMLDVPTQWADGGNGRGNYATLNPLLYMGSGSTKSNGNLRFVGGGTGGPPYNYSIYGTFAVNAGKWYWETTITTAGSQPFVGMFNTAVNFNGGSLQGSAGPVLYGYDGNYYNETTGVSFGNTYTTGDVIGIAVDFDNNLIWFSKNGTWQNSGNPSSGTNGKTFGSGKTWAAGYVESGSSASASTFDLTFGQRPFSYTPPSGFKALNTLNLPTPTILKGNQYFDAVTWTGTGSNQQVALNFTSDFVWAKRRNGADSHLLYDVLRGINKDLSSNSTAAEATNDYGLDFDNGSYLDITGTKYFGGGGGGSPTFVAWNWKEGATQGFDIVLYTGTGATLNVSHNLGVAPKMIITKSRSAVGGWPVYHASIGATGAVQLESTGATSTTSAYWNNTAPTSTQFTLASGLSVNGTTYVAYLFAEVAGYSAFGSYTGNGSADGPMVFTGFLPRWIMFKKSSATSNWSIIDTARDTFNVADNPLLPNTSGAETTSTSTSGAFLDVLSNGFKLRGNSGDINDSGATYIFAAFASVPFKNSLAF